MNRSSLVSLLLAFLLILLLAGLAAAGGPAPGRLAAPRIDPPAPVNISFDSDVIYVAVQGDYAYVGLESGLAILDITHPLQPVTLSFMQQQYLQFIEPQGNLLVISNNTTNGFLDVSNPYYPTWISPMRNFLITVRDMVLYGDYLYIVGKGAFTIVDIHNPAAPQVVFEMEDFGVIGNMKSLAVGVNPADGRTYASMTGYRWCNPGGCIANGLLIMDVTDPAAPQVVYASTETGTEVATDGEYLYWVDIYGFLHIFSLADPQQPLLVSRTDIQANVYDMQTVQNKLYMALYYGEYGKVEVLDVSNKGQPSELAFYDDVQHWMSLSVSEEQGCIFVAERSRGLRILCDANASPHPPSLVWLPLFQTNVGS